ncbi:hypothetical protein [Halovulum sp. GXIMD14793]
MSRKIGFGNQGGRKSGPRSFVKMLIVLALMDAMAFALVIRSFLKENWIGVGVGLTFSGVVSLLMLFAILRKAQGEAKVCDPGREWEMKDHEAGD